MILKRVKILCEVCHKKYSFSIYTKWHGIGKCKAKKIIKEEKIRILSES